MRMFKITACVPSQTRIRTQRELQNTYFTKLVPYENWFREQQRIQKMGGKIVKVELATGKPGSNTGLAQLFSQALCLVSHTLRVECGRSNDLFFVAKTKE